MTRLTDQQLRDLGEPPSSIAYLRRAEEENPTPISDERIVAAADRVASGERLFDVIAELCRPEPMEKL